MGRCAAKLSGSGYGPREGSCGNGNQPFRFRERRGIS
jgi:hypothetical protein